MENRISGASFKRVTSLPSLATSFRPARVTTWDCKARRFRSTARQQLKRAKLALKCLLKITCKSIVLK
jgi:hypothetical protein